tara:strand:+ start:339 stop:533 length:195 start_codon:yes stop_codon:yes gene_type:complete
MKVKELIQILKNIPQELPIRILDVSGRFESLEITKIVESQNFNTSEEWEDEIAMVPNLPTHFKN